MYWVYNTPVLFYFSSSKSKFILNISSLTKKYIDLTDLIQKEFDRNVDKYGDKIKCRKGCSQCCTQIFRITQFDADVIKNHLNTVNTEFKNSLKKKAEDYLRKTTTGDLKAVDFFSEPTLPCPALNQDGACMIYEARPVICRRFGPPVYDYKNPGKLFACELNFSDGEEIIDNELIPNQSMIGIEWDELKTIYNKNNDLDEIASTTIAKAILNS